MSHHVKLTWWMSNDDGSYNSVKTARPYMLHLKQRALKLTELSWLPPRNYSSVNGFQICDLKCLSLLFWFPEFFGRGPCQSNQFRSMMLYDIYQVWKRRSGEGDNIHDIISLSMQEISSPWTKCHVGQVASTLQHLSHAEEIICRFGALW